MYYIITLIIYFILIAFYFYARSITNKEDNKKYKKEFSNFAKKQLEAYPDWKSGKIEHEVNKGKKEALDNLSGKEKFILYMGMFCIFFGFAVFVALYFIIRKYVVVKPSDVVFFEYILAFSYLGCFASVVCSVTLSVPLKRLIDKNNVMENVSGEPKTTFKQDLYIISIILLICFPIIAFSMNTYRYVDNDGFHYKGFLSLKEKNYSYEEFDHVEKVLYNEWHNYDVVLKNGKKMKLCEEVYFDFDEKLANKLLENNIEIKEVK